MTFSKNGARTMGILDQAIREIALEKQAAEDEYRQAQEDFDLITFRAVDTLKKMVTTLRMELLAADWWMDEITEDNQRPEYLSLSFQVRRHAKNPDPVTNPDYVYRIKFDAAGGAVRTINANEALLEPMLFRAVARQDVGTDLENDLKLLLKAMLYKH
jgi:hypothetical protein